MHPIGLKKECFDAILGGIEMKRIANRRINSVIIVVAVVIVINVILAIVTSIKPDIGECRNINCDVKVFSLSTKIEATDEDGNMLGMVKGKVIRFFTDPLAMYDSSDNKIAYGSDEYHIISQDSHTIYVGNIPVYEMTGKFNMFGDTYDIYDMSGNKIAVAKFNMFNTYGTITSVDDVLWADYYSNLYRFDFKIRVKEECPIDDTALIMIMSSFYSDRSADSSNSGSRSNSND